MALLGPDHLVATDLQPQGEGMMLSRATQAWSSRRFWVSNAHAASTSEAARAIRTFENGSSAACSPTYAARAHVGPRRAQRTPVGAIPMIGVVIAEVNSEWNGSR